MKSSRIAVSLVCLVAGCDGGREVSAPAANQGAQEPPTVSQSQEGPGSIAVAPASDLVPLGSAEQQSEVHLAPLMESGARQAIVLEYQEGEEGSLLGPYLSYRLQDELGLVVSLDIDFELDRVWSFQGSSPIVVRVDATERQVLNGTLTVSESDAGRLRIDLGNLDIEGESTLLQGYILGEPVERCRHLVDQAGGATAAGVASRALELDENWTSEFCASVQRRYP